MRIQISQCCAGMEYLHSQRVVHFDLKCDNLLADLRDMRQPLVKIGDVGLSKHKAATAMSGNMRGTLPWMAPEMFPAMSASRSGDGKQACLASRGRCTSSLQPCALRIGSISRNPPHIGIWIVYAAWAAHAYQLVSPQHISGIGDDSPVQSAKWAAVVQVRPDGI